MTRPAPASIEPATILPTPIMPDFLSVAATAKLLRVNPKTVRLWIKAGSLEASSDVKGGPLQVTKASIAKLINS